MVKEGMEKVWFRGKGRSCGDLKGEEREKDATRMDGG